MKTLDEVIKAFEKCDGDCGKGCEFSGAYGCNAMYQTKNDALHYLKEYKKLGNNLVELGKDEQVRCGTCKFYGEDGYCKRNIRIQYHCEPDWRCRWMPKEG